MLSLETDLDIRCDLEGRDIHHRPSSLLGSRPCTSCIFASLDATSGYKVSESQAAQGKDGGVMALLRHFGLIYTGGKFRGEAVPFLINFVWEASTGT